MTIEDFNKLCLKKDIHLSDNELKFSYTLIKNNYLNITNIDITPYKDYFSNENYIKITNLINEYQDIILKYLKK